MKSNESAALSRIPTIPEYVQIPYIGAVLACSILFAFGIVGLAAWTVACTTMAATSLYQAIAIRRAREIRRLSREGQ